MPSIFEKPSLLGFRQEGGVTPAKKNKGIIPAIPGFITDNLGKVSDVATGYGANLMNQFWGTNWNGTNFSETPFTPGGGLVDQIQGYMQTGEIPFFSNAPVAPVVGSGRGASGSWGDPVVPAAPTSIFGPPAPGSQIFGPPSILANQQPAAAAAPTGTRAERVKAAMESGDFAEKQRQYNQEAMRMGHPSMMDDQGNIVGRELTVPEQMRDAFMRTGGNTPFMQTNDPMQRAMQNEMMKQARGQIAANTFGFTPEERRANLEEEVNARKILATPLDSGVREVAPGVRAATRDGQTVGFSTPGDGKNVPQGTIKDPITGQEMPLALYTEMTRQTQATKGMTGGSPMERGLIAAMAAEEARKKKLASDAAAAAVAAAAIPPTPAAPEPGFRTSPTTFGVTPQGLPADTPQAASTNARAQSPFLPKPKR
jgi:hypothetical protein